MGTIGLVASIVTIMIGVGIRLKRFFRYKKNLRPGEGLKIFLTLNPEESFLLQTGTILAIFSVAYLAFWQ